MTLGQCFIHDVSNVLESLQVMMLEVKRYKGEVKTRWPRYTLSSPRTTHTVHSDAVLHDDNKSFVARKLEARRQGDTCYSSQHAGLATARGPNYEQGVASL